MSDQRSVQDRLLLYCTERKCAIQMPPLGEGTDGGVFRTDKKTAIKVFLRRESYEKERDCYRILMENDVTEICGFAVPRIIEYHDGLMVVPSERLISTKHLLMTASNWQNGSRNKCWCGRVTGQQFDESFPSCSLSESFKLIPVRATSWIIGTLLSNWMTIFDWAICKRSDAHQEYRAQTAAATTAPCSTTPARSTESATA